MATESREGHQRKTKKEENDWPRLKRYSAQAI